MRVQSAPVTVVRNFMSPRGHGPARRRTLLHTAGGIALLAPLARVSTVQADDEPVDPLADLAPADPALAALTPLEVQVLALVNGARAERGVAPLEWDATMTDVARDHATEMMRTGVISHTSADGSTPAQRMRRAGVVFQYGSENIWTYWGNDPASGPSTMHAAMMAEPWAPGLWNHIGNILYTGYRRIGVGVMVARSGNQYLSEMFAD